MSWTQPRALTIPWMRTLSGLFDRISMPGLFGQNLWVTSDYSFDNQASDFDVIGVLLADPSASGEWHKLRNAVRANILIDSRTMSWKKLNSDTRRQAALLPFMNAADHITGLAVAIAFRRDSALEIPDDAILKFTQAFHLGATWKRRNLQQMFRIAYCTATLVAGISRSKQNVHWVSDQDSAFSSDAHERDTVTIFSKLLSIFAPHILGEIRYGTTGYGDEPLFQEDLVAVPDLMCGAACELFTAINREFGHIPTIYTQMPKLSKRPHEVLKWYGTGPWPLKRYFCVIEKHQVCILPQHLLL